MNYTVKLTGGTYGTAEIIGLPDIYLHFAHHNFNYVWNSKTKTQDRVDEDVFFGGMGEGSEFKTWQDAIHSSLYDAYQVYDGLNDGDTLVAEYLGETQRFACDGVHVVKVN